MTDDPAFVYLPVRRSQLAELRCRHVRCKSPPVGIYLAPAGCRCWTDPVQALCAQHACKVQSAGPVTLLLDLREPPGPASPPLEPMRGLEDREPSPSPASLNTPAHLKPGDEWVVWAEVSVDNIPEPYPRTRCVFECFHHSDNNIVWIIKKESVSRPLTRGGKVIVQWWSDREGGELVSDRPLLVKGRPVPGDIILLH